MATGFTGCFQFFVLDSCGVPSQRLLDGGEISFNSLYWILLFRGWCVWVGGVTFNSLYWIHGINIGAEITSKLGFQFFVLDSQFLNGGVFLCLNRAFNSLYWIPSHIFGSHLGA